MMEALLALCCARPRQRGDSGSVRDYPNPNTHYEALPDFRLQRMSITMADLSGYLLKVGSASKPSKSLWFVLKNDLFYFDDERSLVPKGVVLLGADDFQPVVTPFESDEGDGIEVLHARYNYLRGEDMAQWLGMFRKAGVTVTGGDNNNDDGQQRSPHDLDPDQVLYEGYLEKHGFADEWKQYWFRLTPSSLDYYASPEDAEPKGSLSLSSAVLSPFVHMPPHMRITNTVVLRCCKPLRVVTGNPDEHSEWITSIKATVEHRRGQTQKNPTGWKRSGKVREVVVPIVDMLRDPFRVEFFRRFLAELNCESYLRFWLDVQQFRRLCKKEDAEYLRPCAQVILKKYLVPGAQFEIDVSDALREDAAARAEEAAIDTFSPCQRAILKVLSEQYYPFYLTSQLSKQMAHELATDI